MEAFIAQYADAGADWVKFQSYQVKTLRSGDPQRDWLAQAELSDEDHWFLKETCARYGTKFLTTVFHRSRVPFLASLGLEAIKIGSGEAGECGLIRDVDAAFSRVLVSCGLSGACADYIQRMNLANWELLECMSRYPSHPCFAKRRYLSRSEVVGMDEGPNLYGWSDHCVGLDGCEIALSCGASIIEKHVSLPEQKREKRSWEATVEEFRELRQFADDDPAKYLGRWQYDGD